MRTRAFSLIELLVVIAIIMILSVSVLASIRPSSDQAKVEEAVNDVISFIRMARQNAMTVLEHPRVPLMYPNYGIHFNAQEESARRTVIMYSICRADNEDPPGLTYADKLHYHNEPSTSCAGRGLIETLQIKHGVRVSEISYEVGTGGTPQSYTHFNILFITPEPTVWFSARNGGAAASEGSSNMNSVLDVGTVYITLEDASGRYSSTISINSVGLVTLQ
jgi:type II secretory pathway pseudopilin PulG